MMDIINVAGSSTLFVRDADRTHSGLYTVEATNGSGTKKENILVQVQGAPFFSLYVTAYKCILSYLFVFVLTSFLHTFMVQTLLASQWDPSHSVTSQRASALCHGAHQ